MAIVICEIGQNFLGSIPLAKILIELAKKNGADLAKFQLYDHNVLYKDHPEIPNYELTKEEAFELFNYGREIGIEVFFSVFDVERVKWCEEIGVKRYKLACGFVHAKTRKNYDVGEAIVKTGKELYMSFSRYPDFPYTTYTPIFLLYCVPKYPAKIDEVNFSDIDKMHGFSDHTIGLDAAKIALARGARIIEKHFSLSHSIGVDGAWSMIPCELRELKRWEKICQDVL